MNRAMTVRDIQVGDVIFDSLLKSYFAVDGVCENSIYSRHLTWYCFNDELHPYITEVKRNGEVIFRRSQ